MPSSACSTPIYRDKILGYLGFRATMVFKLVVNATRFQQGRYILSWIPTGGTDSFLNNATAVRDAHMSTLTQRTQLPRVEIDISCDTEALLKVPYNSLLNFFPSRTITGTSLPATGYGNTGFVSLTPYSPVASAAGALTCGFVLWCWFEDVEMVNAAVPQSRNVYAVTRSRSETEAEQQAEGISPVSSTLIRVRDASALFAKVPLLSSYANSVSWFSDVCAKAANVFGYSRPINLEHSQRMQISNLPYNGNYDAVDNSWPLAYSAKNEIGRLPGFSGTDTDELDFSFFASIPAWINTTAWTTAGTVGSLLYSQLISPRSLNGGTVTLGTGSATHHTPLSFVANYFSMWRGSIIVRIKIVKTEFHSGRLALLFSPYETAVSLIPAPTLLSSQYVHREVIDIRYGNEWTFEIPYISSVPFKSTFENIPAHMPTTGVFGIIILDPLVAPSTVSSTVNLLIEYGGGPDIQFAVPTSFGPSPVLGVVPQSRQIYAVSQSRNILGDNLSADIPTNVCSRAATTLGSSKATMDDGVHCLYSVGEKLNSFRQILKRPQSIIYNGSIVQVDTTLNIYPYMISWSRYNSVGPVFSGAPTVDNYSAIASIFCYHRGGVRLKYVDLLETAPPINGWVEWTVTSDPAYGSSTQIYTINNGVLSPSNSNNPGCRIKTIESQEVQVPQYSNLHSRPVTDCSQDSTNFVSYTDVGTGLGARLYVTVTKNSNSYVDPVPANSRPFTYVGLNIYRSGADDFNLGYFISIPPMMNYPTG